MGAKARWWVGETFFRLDCGTSFWEWRKNQLFGGGGRCHVGCDGEAQRERERSNQGRNHRQSITKSWFCRRPCLRTPLFKGVSQSCLRGFPPPNLRLLFSHSHGKRMVKTRERKEWNLVIPPAGRQSKRVCLFFLYARRKLCAGKAAKTTRLKIYLPFREVGHLYVNVVRSKKRLNEHIHIEETERTIFLEAVTCEATRTALIFSLVAAMSLL